MLKVVILNINYKGLFNNGADEGHYVLVTGLKKDKIAIIDPMTPHKEYCFSIEKIRKSQRLMNDEVISIVVSKSQPSFAAARVFVT